MRFWLIWAMFQINYAISFGQFVSVESGNLNLHSGVLSLNSTALINNAELNSESGTIVSIQGIEPTMLSGSSEIRLHSVKLGADCELNTELTIIDSIFLSEGNLDLTDYSLTLEGTIIGESETGRILSSGSGEIIKTFDLPAHQNFNPGNIGLSLNVESEIVQFELRRGHIPIINSNDFSIERYYSLTPINGSYTLTFNYLDAELDNAIENSLGIWGESYNVWESIVDYHLNTVSNELSATLSNPYTLISLFPGERADIVIPKGFSPNGDGVNDQFVIDGAENLLNNKLVIFNQWGEIVFEASPYKNNWEGESEFRLASQRDKKLFDGTYFYFFYKDMNNESSVQKGFFEIKSNQD